MGRQTSRFYFHHILAAFCHLWPVLDRRPDMRDSASAVDGGVPVSTWEMRQWRHAEDGSLASLIFEPKNNC